MKPERSRGLHGRVIHDLGRMIVAGQFPAGAPLPAQEECCALLGVSRSVLREALRVLAAKGLIEARPKAGTFVTPREDWNFLDPDLLAWRLETAESERVMEQLYELRQMVEPMAAALAASKARVPDLHRIHQAYEAMAAAANEEQAVERDLNFHRAIIAASGNDLFASLGRTVESALAVTFRIGVHNPHGSGHTLEMHRDILDAIVNRDPPAARLAMQRLIEYSKETVAEIRARRPAKRTVNTSPTPRRRPRSA